MAVLPRYIATLRCRTWHTWPEKIHFATNGFQLKLPGGAKAIARVVVASYLGRSSAHDYTPERAELGPLIWRGEVPGLYSVREAILKSPEDKVSITLEYEPPRKGEIDLLVALDVPGELPGGAPDSLRCIALAFMSFLNLRLGEHLMPCAPMQVARVAPSSRKFDNTVLVAVANRDALSPTAVQDVVHEFYDAVLRGSGSAKLQTALELYGTYIFERNAKTRFLLLIMAMEVLTTPALKHAAALRLLDNWKAELTAEKGRFAESTPEFVDLTALERELLFRREVSIRTQVRNLMSRVSKWDKCDGSDLPARALRVYDKRSSLVHDGALPTEEIVGLEREARELLEAAIRFLLAESKNSDLAG